MLKRGQHTESSAYEQESDQVDEELALLQQKEFPVNCQAEAIIEAVDPSRD